jgi:O-antigen ligase
MMQTIISDQKRSGAIAAIGNAVLENKSGVGSKVAVVLIALMPLSHTLITWDWDGQISAVNYALRHYGLLIVWLELVILLIAARVGWKPLQQFFGLPTAVKWLCAGAILSVIFTSVWASNSPTLSLLFAFRYLVHGLLIGSLIFLIRKDQNFRLSNWAFWLSCGFALYLVALTAFCMLVPNPQSFPWVRGIPSATNIRQIGNVVGIMALVPATLLLFGSSMRKDAFAASLLMVLLTFATWSGSRGALLGFGVAMAVAGWISRDRLAISKIILLVFSFTAALAISMFIPSPAPEFGIFRMAESLNSDDLSSGRWQIWQFAVEAIKTAPFFGHGAGNYRVNMELLTGLPFNHPHNFVLQLVYDWGIVGGGLALTLIAGLGFMLLRSDEGTVDERFLSLSGFVGTIAMASIDGALFYPLPIIIAVALISPHLARGRP